MARLDRILTKIENFVAGASLGAAALLATLAVILRYGFNYVIFWSEEAVIYLIILSTFVGAVITLRHNEHVNIDIVPALLGERGKRVMAIIAAFFVVVYCAVIGGYAWLMITEPAVRMSFTLAMHLPLWVVQLSLPIGLTLMLVRALEILYRTARGRETFEEAEDTAYEEEASR
jgi:C4-dicarboxylate transporter DctQ subunit